MIETSKRKITCFATQRAIELVALSIFCSIGLLLTITKKEYTEPVRFISVFDSLINIINNIYGTLPNERFTSSFLAIGLIALFLKYNSIRTKSQNKIMIYLISFLFSFLQLLALSYKTSSGTIYFTGSYLLIIKTWWKIIAYSIVLYCVLTIIVYYMDCLDLKGDSEKIDKKTFIKVFLLTWFVFLIWLVALYPGILGNDAIDQIKSYLGISSQQTFKLTSWYNKKSYFITNHHPFLTTLLFGAFIDIGIKTKTSLGIVLYNILHSGMMAFTFSYCIMYFAKFRINKKVLIATCVGYALFLPNCYISVTMMKDSLYAMAHMWLFIFLIEYVKTNGKIANKIKYCISFFLIIFLYSTTRSQGIYIIAVLGLTVLLLKKRCLNTKKILILCLANILIVTIGINGFLANKLNIAPSGKQEMLGVFFQQTARYVSLEKDITEFEKKSISSILPYDKLGELYTPENQDNVKYKYNQQASNEDLLKYFEAWLAMFVRHPKIYIDSTLCTIYKAFYITQNSSFAYTDYNMERFGSVEGVIYNVPETKIYEIFSKIARSLIELMQRLPIVNLLFSLASFLWNTIFLMIMIGKKEKAYLFAFVPTISLMLTFIICPIMNWRYFLPITWLMPLSILLFYSLDNNQANIIESDER